MQKKKKKAKQFQKGIRKLSSLLRVLYQQFSRRRSAMRLIYGNFPVAASLEVGSSTVFLEEKRHHHPFFRHTVSGKLR